MMKSYDNTRYLLYAVALSVFLLIVWASFASLDSVAQGMGQVVPAQRVQVIQNLEGGILSELVVREGQLVKKGDLLARIDNETAGSQYREALARSLDVQASIARLEAEITGKDPQYPAAVLQSGAALAARHADLLGSRREQRQSELRVLEAQKQLRQHDLAEQEARLRNITTALTIAKKQLAVARPLLQSHAYSALDFLNLEQKEQSLQSDIDALRLGIPRTITTIEEAEERLNMRQHDLNTQNYNEIIKLQTELMALNELLTAGGDKLTRTEIRSPVRGIVQRIHSNTLGGVIKPAENIMTIIPANDTLVIEAKVSPTDIAFLYPGQKAIVRLSAYDFSVYGGLEATVDQISADTMEGRQGEIFYQVKLKTTDSSLMYEGKSLPILPGMMAQVDILIGKKTVLEYLLKPILRIQQKALRER